ncbi:MAG: hypothetical protein ACP5I4_03375 [Oceanipulchritudo sp.]
MFERTRDNWRMASRRFKRRLILTGILVVVLFIALTWVLQNWHGEVTPPAEPLAPVAGEEVRKLEEMGLKEPEDTPGGYAERFVLDQHFSAIGGVDVLSSITSIRIKGKLTFPEGQTQDVIIIKKGGDMVRIAAQTHLSKWVSVVTPKESWRAIYRMGELASVEDLEPETVQTMKRHAYVTSELFMALENSWDVKYVGERDFNYKMAHTFEVQTAPDLLVRFYLDPETYLDIGREDRKMEEDGLVITKHLYLDHFATNGLKVPSKVETYVNGELRQEFDIEQVEINPGILESSFKQPPMPEASPDEE